MNFTLDDTSSNLAYSPAWTIQSLSDPKRTAFFEATYHATQVDGARLNMSVAGSAFYLYGSRGPGHGNFSVQYDDTVVLLSAYANETAYRQLLFAHTFDAGSTSPHFICLTARLTGNDVYGSWLDFDYVTFTTSSPPALSSSATGVSAIALPTAIPPWLSVPLMTVSRTSSGLSEGLTSGTANSSGLSSPQSCDPDSTVPVVLAALFGSVIILIFVSVFAFYVLRRLYESRRTRDHNFRYGQSTVTTSNSGLIRALDSNAALGLPPFSVAPSGPGNGARAGKANDTPAFTPPSSTDFGRNFGGSGATAAVGGNSFSTMSSVSASATAPQANTSSTPFAFLATAQALPFKIGSRRHEGDADSLRTDFLQV